MYQSCVDTYGYRGQAPHSKRVRSTLSVNKLNFIEARVF
ncbi:hypothetical protein C4K00_2695 [Pseudomonas synxantha]|nr:hypothetical protein C4K00_2695 [Pseudomonas synxantha]